MDSLLKRIVRSFFLITTLTLLSTAVFVSVFYRDCTLSVEILWQIIFVGFITAIPAIIFYSKKDISKKSMIIRQIIHFIIINLVLVGSAVAFDWIDGSFIQVAFLLLLVLLVYVSVWVGCYKDDAKIAQKLNQRLKEYQEK